MALKSIAGYNLRAVAPGKEKTILRSVETLYLSRIAVIQMAPKQ